MGGKRRCKRLYCGFEAKMLSKYEEKTTVSHFLEQDISESSGLKWKQKLRGFLEDKIQTEGKF